MMMHGLFSRSYLEITEYMGISEEGSTCSLYPKSPATDWQSEYNRQNFILFHG